MLTSRLCNHDGVIPKARAFTSGPRDLAWAVLRGGVVTARKKTAKKPLDTPIA